VTDDTRVAPLPIWAAVVWLALIGAAAVVVGGHDTAVGHEIDVRLTGAAVLAAGVVMLAGAVGLYRRRPRGRALASVAALLGVALGLFTFVAQTVNDDPDSRLIAWGAVIVLSLAAFTVIRTSARGADDETGIFAQLPVLKSAVSLGLLLSLVQFWHSTIYLPTRAPVTVTIEPKFDKPVRQGERFVIQGTVTVKNTSGARLIPVATSLVLSGNVVAKRPVLDRARIERAGRDADKGTHEEAALYPVRPENVILQRGRFLPEDAFFEPDETITRPFIAWSAAKLDLDFVRLDVQLALARATVAPVDDPSVVETQRTRESTVITRSVPEDGWLQGLTRGPRFVITEYYRDPWIPKTRQFYPLDVGFNQVRSPDLSPDFSDRMIRFYGVNFSTASAVVPLLD
jgi:uncharacterized membrane protein